MNYSLLEKTWARFCCDILTNELRVMSYELISLPVAFVA